MKTKEQTKPGYQHTKLGWIPEEWEEATLGETKSKDKWSITGGPFGSDLKVSDYIEHGGVRVLQLQNIGDGEFNHKSDVRTSDEKADQLLACNIYPGEIIISKMGDPVARACFIPDTEPRYVMASDGIRLKVNEKEWDSKFVLSLINSERVRNMALRWSIGSTRRRIGLSDLKNLPFVKPPLAEQQKIATILSTWDNAIGQQQALIAAKQQFKKGLMQNLLTGKKRFPGFTEKWRSETLSEVGSFKNGKGHEKIIDDSGEIVVVNSKFISTEGKVYKTCIKNLCPLEKGDITMVMSDIPNGKALGKCYLIPESDKYSLNQRICSIKVKSGFSNIFTYFLLNRNQYYLGFNNGVSQTNLRKDDVLECPLFIPPLPEQQKIAAVLSAADAEIEKLKTQLTALQAQKKGLMQKLLSGEVRTVSAYIKKIHAK